MNTYTYKWQTFLSVFSIFGQLFVSDHCASFALWRATTRVLFAEDGNTAGQHCEGYCYAYAYVVTRREGRGDSLANRVSTGGCLRIQVIGGLEKPNRTEKETIYKKNRFCKMSIFLEVGKNHVQGKIEVSPLKDLGIIFLARFDISEK